MEPCLFCSDMLLRAEINTARYLHGDTDQSSSSCKCHYLTCGASLELGRRVARGGRGLVSSAPFLQPLGYFPVECLHPAARIRVTHYLLRITSLLTCAASAACCAGCCSCRSRSWGWGCWGRSRRWRWGAGPGARSNYGEVLLIITTAELSRLYLRLGAGL